MSLSRNNIRIVSFVAAVFAMLLVSSRAIASGHGSSHGHEPAAAEAGSDVEPQGIEFGEFQVRSYYPVEAQKSTVTFALYASVPDEKLAAMKEFVEKHENKLRDQVITTTRLTPLADFDQAELTAFRRRILMRLRRTLPELEITDIYVSDFTLLVKSL